MASSLSSSLLAGKEGGNKDGRFADEPPQVGEYHGVDNSSEFIPVEKGVFSMGWRLAIEML